jgi:hypothetical protein
MFGGADHGKDGVNGLREPPKTTAPDLTAFPEKVEKEEHEEDEEEDEEGRQNVTKLDEDKSLEKTGDEMSETTATSPIPHSISTGATLVRKFGSLLVGRGDENKRLGTLGKRATILGVLPPRPSRDVGEEDMAKKEGVEDEKEKVVEGVREEVDEQGRIPTTKFIVDLKEGQPVGSFHRRAATILDPQGRAARHERRSSTGGALLAATTGGTIGRHRRPSTGYSGGVKPMVDRLFARTEEESRDKKGSEGGEIEGIQRVGREVNFKEEDERHTSEKDFKPVFLKGLFRSAI